MHTPSRWLPCALLIATLLVWALLALPQATQSVQAAPPPNPSSIYFLSSCSNTYQTTAVYTAFSENLSVCVGRWADVGARNNHVAGIAVTFTAITPLTGPSAGASGIFANGTDSVTVISGSNGMATATTFSANGTPGTYVVTATAADSSPNSFSMTNGDSTVPAVLSIGDGSGQAAQVNNQMTQVNTAFRIPLSVAVFDGQNNYMPGVTVTFSAPDTGASGTFANGATTTTATTNSTGIATASRFTANGTDGIYSVRVSIGRLTNYFALQNTQYNPFGVPVTVSVAGGSPQTVDIETSFPSILQVVVLDGGLSYVPGATVTFTAVPGPTGASGTFANGTDTTTATTGPTGLATATRLTANHAAGQFSILVTAGRASTSAVYYNLAIETTTTLTNAPTATTYGQPTTLTATVSPVRGASIPTGYVAFKDNGTVIEECKKAPLSGNVATCQATTINAGVRQVTAEYLGDAGLFPSTSNAVTQTIAQAGTTATLQSSLNPANVNQRITFTAKVAVQEPGGGIPTGTVTFMDGTTPLGTPVTLDKGQATLSIATLAPGDHPITAAYSGSPNYLASTAAPLKQTVSAPTLVVAPDVLPNGAAGQPYSTTTFTASGGTAPYRFAVTNGALPPGLTLDATTSALDGTPTQAGSFTVTVTVTDASQFTGTRRYTVTIAEAEVTGIAIMAGNTPTTALTLTVGQSSQLTAQKVLRDGSNQPLSGAQWTVSNPEIASVDANGKVTGLSQGTATVTVRLNSVTQTLTLTVPAQTPGGSIPAAGNRPSGTPGAPTAPAPVPSRSGPVSPASGGATAPNPVPTRR